MSWSKSIDDIGYGGRYRSICLIAAPLVAIRLFVATHGTPGQQIAKAAEDKMSCSSRAALEIVTEIVKKRLFTPEALMVVDPDQFGARFDDIVMEARIPVTCTADFIPTSVSGRRSPRRDRPAKRTTSRTRPSREG